MTTTTDSTTPSTDLATTQDQQLAPVIAPEPMDLALLQRVSKLPKHVQDHLKLSPKPTFEQLQALLAKVPEAKRAGVAELLESANPNKQGVEGGAKSFKPRLVKLYHGTGNDPIRPENLVPGGFYDSAGYVIDTATERLTLLLITKNRALWPAQGDEGASRKPLCSSPDRQKGTLHGACASCQFSQKKSNEGGCTAAITAYFMNADCSVIYRVIFSKSSYQTGETLFKLANASPRVWGDVYTISSAVQTSGKNKWYVWKIARATKDAKNAPEMMPLFEMFSRFLWHEVYFNELLWTYSPLTRGAGADGSPAVEGGAVFDAGALLGEAVPEENADFGSKI